MDNGIPLEIDVESNTSDMILAGMQEGFQDEGFK